MALRHETPLVWQSLGHFRIFLHSGLARAYSVRMEREPRRKMSLTMQRILIVLFVVLALGMAGGTIYATMSEYRAQDEAATPAP
jgi:hypothetical protein